MWTRENCIGFPLAKRKGMIPFILESLKSMKTFGKSIGCKSGIDLTVYTLRLSDLKENIPSEDLNEWLRILLRGFELVADFSDGVDEGWVVRIGFDFVAQGGDEAVDAALADEAIVAPDGVEDIIAG